MHLLWPVVLLREVTWRNWNRPNSWDNIIVWIIETTWNIKSTDFMGIFELLRVELDEWMLLISRLLLLEVMMRRLLCLSEITLVTGEIDHRLIAVLNILASGWGVSRVECLEVLSFWVMVLQVDCLDLSIVDLNVFLIWVFRFDKRKLVLHVGSLLECEHLNEAFRIGFLPLEDQYTHHADIRREHIKDILVCFDITRVEYH